MNIIRGKIRIFFYIGDREKKVENNGNSVLMKRAINFKRTEFEEKEETTKDK